MRTPIRKGGKFTHLKPDPHITPAKFDELKRQLEKLKNSLPKAIAEVKRLGELGDFSENAAYALAKGRLRGLNHRVLELEGQIKNAELISPDKGNNIVQIGSRVTIDISGKQTKYLILGSTETDPTGGVISHKSPIGAALLGHKVGDKVSLRSVKQGFDCIIINIE